MEPAPFPEFPTSRALPLLPGAYVSAAAMTAPLTRAVRECPCLLLAFCSNASHEHACVVMVTINMIEKRFDDSYVCEACTESLIVERKMVKLQNINARPGLILSREVKIKVSECGSAPKCLVQQRVAARTQLLLALP